MITLLATVCTDDAGTTTQVMFTDGLGWTTKPADTPASTHVDRGLRAGTFTREMFAGDRVTGGVRFGSGVIEIDNTDGRLDAAWITYAVDGRAFSLYWRETDDGAAFPAQYTEVVRGFMLRHEMTLTKLVIYLRDSLEDFDKPLCPSVYDGSGGVNGTTAMAGRRVPAGYGHVFNAAPVLVDPSILLYQMGSAYETSTLDQSVRDGGAVLSNGAAYSSLSDLLTGSSPSSGQARHYAPAGMFRLGSVSVYEVTADRKFHDTTTSVASKLIERMALDSGRDAGRIDTIASAGLTAGFYSPGDDTTFAAAMARVAGGSGLWFGPNRLDMLQVRQFVDPAGETSDATIEVDDVIGIERKTPPGSEVPCHTVRLRWARNWHPLSQVAGSVSAEANILFRREWREAQSADASILDRHPYADELVRDTYAINLATWGDPSAEATRVLNLFGADRVMYRVALHLGADTLVRDLGDVVTLKHTRFGLSAGQKFAVVAVALDLGARTVTLSLWG